MLYVYQDKQDDQECPKIMVLKDFEYLDRGINIVTLYMLSFWNPQDYESILELFSRFFVTIRMNRKVKDIQNLGL